MKVKFSLTGILLVFAFFNSRGQNELKVGAKAPQILFSKSFPKPYTIPAKKPILLDFWATWCGPCVAALIESNSFVRKYHKSLEFIAITDYTSRKVPEFIKAKDFDYQFIIDRDTSTTTAFGVSFLPMAFLIDSNNVIQWVGNSREIDEAMIQEFIATGKVVPRVFRYTFDTKRYDTIHLVATEYTLVITNKQKLDASRSVLVGKTDDERGNYSSQPEVKGALTVINYNLNMLTQKIAPYFGYLKLKCDIKNAQGYDFIEVPFDNFEKLNTSLEKKYGLSFKPAQ